MANVNYDAAKIAFKLLFIKIFYYNCIHKSICIMENYLSSQEAPSPAKPVRPTFLTILCILTFLGSGLGILSGIRDYFSAATNADLMQAYVEDVKEKLASSNSDEASSLGEEMLTGSSEVINKENLQKNAMFNVVASVFTFIGGFLMFQLKKLGFWVYILGTIISIAAPFAIFGSKNLLSLGIAFIFALIGVLFVILYALNLKFLK